MGPAGAEADAEEIGMREAGHHARMRHGVPATLRHGHALALGGVARDRRFDVDRTLAQVPPHDRRIHALDGASFDCAREPAVREIGLRDDQQSGRVAIEPVHDAGAAFRGTSRKLGAPPHQHIYLRVVPMTWPRMADETGGFVEDGEVLVFKDEPQLRVRRGERPRRFLFRELHRDLDPGLEHRGCTQRLAARGHAFIGDEASGLCTRDGELVGEEAIEAFSRANNTEGDVQGSAARASLARCCARPSCQSESPRAMAPIVMAESATLKVGQRHAPTPTSTKSTTPCALRMRSMRLPTAPPQTSASASSRKRSPGRVLRTSEASTNSATTASAMKIQRELSPTCRPKAAPSL